MWSKAPGAITRTAGRIRARVLSGHEVGDGLDRWVPLIGVPGARVRSVSGRSGGETRAARWLLQRGPGTGPRGRRKEGGKQAAGGWGETVPRPRVSEGETNSFYFFYFSHFLLKPNKKI